MSCFCVSFIAWIENILHVTHRLGVLQHNGHAHDDDAAVIVVLRGHVSLSAHGGHRVRRLGKSGVVGWVA